MITILGGSAHSTPALVNSLSAKSLKDSVTIRLAGRNRERLSAVARACSILGSRDKVLIQQFGPDDWDEALTDSDVVLVQIRAGDYEGRCFDETFPLQHGVPGDEGLGPGGLSAAHRVWPELAALFERIQICAPNAYTLLLSSPGSLLVRAAKIQFPNWVLTAACELPFTTLQHISAVLGHRWDQVTFEYTGVNHLGWLYDVNCNGEDLLNSYVHSETPDSFPRKQLVADSGAFPLKYLRLHYEMETAVEKQRTSTGSRAEQLSAIASHSFEIFQSGDKDEILRALRARPADWYSHAIAPLLRACIEGESRMPFFLSIASASGDVRERCYYAHNGQLHASLPKRPAPESVSDLVDRFVEYERIAAEAVLDGSEQALAKALERHPWVKERLSARALAQAITGHSRSYWERRSGVYADFKVAIIGCGRMGRERARCVRDLGGTVAVVYDVDLSRARSLASEYNSGIMEDPNEVVSAGVQAIFFCTPPNRRTLVLEAIHAKLPFFVEKPIGTSLAACTPVLQALRSTPVIHSVGYMNRNRASVLHTRALLRRCTVLGISAHLVGRAYSVPWWLDEAASGGPQNEQATHAFDLSRFLIGEISCVSTTLPEPTTGKRPSLSAASSIRFECGAVGCVFYSCQANAKDIGARIFAAEGSVALSGWDLRMTENTIDGSMPEIQSEDIFLVETGTFMKAVQTGRQDFIACDWADAMRTQAVMDASRNCAGVLV